MKPFPSARFSIFARKVVRIWLAWMFVGIAAFFYEYLIFLQQGCTPPYFEFSRNFVAYLIAVTAGSFIGGAIIVGYFENWLRTRPYGQALLLILAVYSLVSLLIAFITGLFFFSYQLRLPILHPAVQTNTLDFISSFDYLRIYLLWLLVLFITIIALMVNDKYGPGILNDFLLGKYFHPKREERIFMFLDLRSSTTIAEQLGEERYFNFVKEVFKDATAAILYFKGEIYQYVGDEIIVSWKMKNGTENANCLQCFFGVQKTMLQKATEYRRQFGVAPEFKAGFHYGYVMAGEVGVVKRDIAFSGDVLNTTARIQSKCNEMGVNILFSKHLLDKLSPQTRFFEPKKIGLMQLRGKQESLELYTV